jgi:hypothetical protein
MKELYVEGLANHGGHESCAGDRKVMREALTVVCTGWVLSPENRYTRVPTLINYAEGNTDDIDKRDITGLCVVEDPRHVQKLPARESGYPVLVSGLIEPETVLRIRKE